VTTDNLAYCWGDGFLGELGDGTFSGHRSAPFPVVGGLRFRQVSGGAAYTCGLTVDSLAYCWGNDVDILSDSSLTARSFPVAVPGGRRFRQVNAGFHTCGVGADSLAYCWGFRNDAGQLGDGTTKRHLIPARVATTVRFRTVVAGFDMSCGIALNHRMYCWGYNGFGELGDGTRTNRLKPVPVSGDRTWGQVGDGSEFYSCGLTLSNQAFCWGLNQQGQLGTGTTNDSRTPVAVAGGHAFGFLNEGGSDGHTCGVTLTHAAYCWGNNENGQVGDGTTTERHVPVRVAGVK
jgi:alpha-tubulin suppressor-like RCC1 family protein